MIRPKKPSAKASRGVDVVGSTTSGSVLRFEGHVSLRTRVICSILSGRPMVISDIRSLDAEAPGLRDYELSLLKLIDSVTNGTVVEINETGTRVQFTPGFVTGGKGISHECPVSRSVTYYLEVLLALAPFAKKPLNVTLVGITNGMDDVTVDTTRTVALPLLRLFGLEDGLELSIKARGAPPNGGGAVKLSVPIVKAQLPPLDLTSPGFVRRIRGVAYAARVSPATTSRMVESSRSVLNAFIPDVFVYTDTARGAEAGASPGFGISLVAESTTGVRYAAEAVASPGATPEDLGVLAAKRLYATIEEGGCVDASHQWLVLLFMALASEDVSSVRLGRLTPYTVSFLRHVKDFFGLTFKLTPDAPPATTVVLTCLGVGYRNLAKRTW